ncbi:hypothetical protein QC762_0001620 [Podospora pseudocomata]|uniref:Uncharacterized protein n=1 Tax=Podospora pseudocomata TaxID=2093779 RepID=A0ABR0GSS6_9PEZI|nr:hypothetical protein QC762_0001620 [Podospora pseudocomata]
MHRRPKTSNQTPVQAIQIRLFPVDSAHKFFFESHDSKPATKTGLPSTTVDRPHQPASPRCCYSARQLHPLSFVPNGAAQQQAEPTLLTILRDARSSFASSSPSRNDWTELDLLATAS